MLQVGSYIVHYHDIIYMMYCTGFTTDGEWNSLHTRGNTRPLSFKKNRANAKAKFAHTGITIIIDMIITLKGVY